MMPHPVIFRVHSPERMDRIHVLIRIVLLAAIGTVGCSSVYWLLFLALPALAALLVSQHGPDRYLAEDAPRVVRVLRWVAAAYAYLWLLTDQWPVGQEPSPVELEVQTGGAPTTSSALLRLVYSLPALLLLAVLSVAASLLWLVGAIVILVSRRLPPAVDDFLALTLRYQFRLAAYHLSLVDRYPSTEDAPLQRDVPQSGAA
jgi:Domain of unknown function (DUF4389)